MDHSLPQEPTMTTATPLPAWMPLSDRALAIPCGAPYFDAIQLDSYTALYVIARLGSHSGPVIEAQTQRVATWLVPVGATARWWPEDVDGLSTGALVTVPPPSWCPG